MQGLREGNAENWALRIGSSLLSYLSVLAAPLLPSAPQEANAEGSRAGAVRHVLIAHTFWVCTHFRDGLRWVGRKSATPAVLRSPPLGEELPRTLK